jgi:hypothetical protein
MAGSAFFMDVPCDAKPKLVEQVGQVARSARSDLLMANGVVRHFVLSSLLRSSDNTAVHQHSIPVLKYQLLQKTPT